MVSEVFTPHDSISTCGEYVTEVIFDESTFLSILFYDKNFSDNYNTGEQVANYDYVPSTIQMDTSENSKEGFYDLEKETFMNIATYGRNYYRNSSYSSKTKIPRVFAVKDLNNNLYYFKKTYN